MKDSDQRTPWGRQYLPLKVHRINASQAVNSIACLRYALICLLTLGWTTSLRVAEIHLIKENGTRVSFDPQTTTGYL